MTIPLRKPEILPANTRIGPFRLIRPLNESGGMATLYLATVRDHYRNSGLPAQIALKIAKVDYEDFLKTEASILARLMAQPGIVRIHPLPGWNSPVFWMTETVKTDRLRNERLCFMAMDYVEGITLRQFLVRNGRLHVALAVGMARQIAASLTYAHDRHIIHLDLKPENVLLRQRSLDGLRATPPPIVLCDFGIARELHSRARIDRAGSPDYVAPEVFQESDPSRSNVQYPADVYMLGEVLYEMLGGCLPYDDLGMKLAGHPFNALSSMGVRMPDRLEAILAQCLAHDPIRRYADATALLQALNEVSSGVRWGQVTKQVAVGGVAALLLAGLVWGGTKLFTGIGGIGTTTPTPSFVASSPAATWTRTPAPVLTEYATSTLRPTFTPSPAPRPVTSTAAGSGGATAATVQPVTR